MAPGQVGAPGAQVMGEGYAGNMMLRGEAPLSSFGVAQSAPQVDGAGVANTVMFSPYHASNVSMNAPAAMVDGAGMAQTQALQAQRRYVADV